MRRASTAASESAKPPVAGILEESLVPLFQDENFHWLECCRLNIHILGGWLLHAASGTVGIGLVTCFCKGSCGHQDGILRVGGNTARAGPAPLGPVGIRSWVSTLKPPEGTAMTPWSPIPGEEDSQLQAIWEESKHFQVVQGGRLPC